MMAKRRTVVLPDYPPPLLRPRGNHWSGTDIDECLDALALHYQLDGRFSELPSRIGDTSESKELQLWMGLAWGLMRDFVPAFGEEKPKAGRPKEIHTKVDYLFPHAHGARLVQIVGALRRLLDDRNLPSTNTAAYSQLLKILKKSPAPLWRYGKFREVSAFQQAWKGIPEDVRDNPNSFFPLHLPQLKFPKALHLEVVAGGRGRSILAMEHMAAYLKRESMERLFEILPPVPSELPK
jgi:hypothetical protein